MDGLLIVDKPAGLTSSDVVQKIRRLLGVDKVGHTGTLDPLATGVLPICLGKATALAQLLTGQEKSYRATLSLGTRTASGDADGAAVETALVPELHPVAVAAAVATLVGPQLQTPPMVSALKVGGKRLHALARAGIEVERAARPITVYTATLEAFSGREIVFAVRCSKGTYLRVLGEELARRLGTVGHLSALRRTSSGRFGLEQAVGLAQLQVEALRSASLERAFVSMAAAVADLPQLPCDDAEARALAYGKKPLSAAPGPPGPVALVDRRGGVLGLAERAADGTLTLSRVFVEPPPRPGAR